MAIKKKVIAREWLILFLSLLLGIVITPLVFFRSYEYKPQDLTQEQKIALLTREQMMKFAIETMQEEKRQLRIQAAELELPDIPPKPFADILDEPDTYLRQADREMREDSARVMELFMELDVVGGLHLPPLDCLAYLDAYLAKAKANIQRHYDSLGVAPRYNYQGLEKAAGGSTDPWEKYKVKAGDNHRGLEKEHFDLDAYLLKENIKLGDVSAWKQLVGHLSSWRYGVETWASVLLLYVVVQIVRSLIWAFKTARGK